MWLAGREEERRTSCTFYPFCVFHRRRCPNLVARSLRMAKLNKSTRLVGGLEIWFGERSRKGLIWIFLRPFASSRFSGWMVVIEL